MRSTIASSSRPTFSTSPKVTAGSVIVPRASIGRRVALDRQLAVDDQLAVLGADQRGVERDVGWRSVSKKSGAPQVGGEVRVLDGDRVGLDAAREAQRAVLVGGQRRVVVLEAAAEGRDDHVLDGEADGRVDVVDGPGGAGGDGSGGVAMAVIGCLPSSGPWSVCCWRNCSTRNGPWSSYTSRTACPPSPSSTPNRPSAPTPRATAGSCSTPPRGCSRATRAA